MKSYLGVSHIDYPNNPDGYLNALGYRELWSLIGFFIPIGSMLFTRGFDITWAKENTPPLWYGGILAVSGFGFPIFFFLAEHLMSKLRKILGAHEDEGLSEMIYGIYKRNTTELWSLYYKTCFVGDITIFLKATTMGWGISSIIYFAIGRT